MDDQKKHLILAGIVAAILGFVCKLLYRPWVLENGIEDWGFQGFGPSCFYALGACLLLSGFSSKSNGSSILFAALGAMAYEIEQQYTSRTFDYKDLLATAAGLLVAILLRMYILTNRATEATELADENYKQHAEPVK